MGKFINITIAGTFKALECVVIRFDIRAFDDKDFSSIGKRAAAYQKEKQ